jgi:hypothetical protein
MRKFACPTLVTMLFCVGNGESLMEAGKLILVFSVQSERGWAMFYANSLLFKNSLSNMFKNRLPDDGKESLPLTKLTYPSPSPNHWCALPYVGCNASTDVALEL